MGFLLISSLLAGIALGAILLLLHLFFWSPERRLSQPESYAVGVGAGWLVYIPLTYLLGIPEASLAYLVMFCIGGSFIIAAWRARRWLRHIDDTAFQAGQENPREPLTQDRIDRGGRDG